MSNQGAAYDFWDKTEGNPLLTKDQLRLIGEAVVIWGEIELFIQQIIWHYFGVQQQEGLLVTATITLEQKKQLLRDLLEQKEPNASRRQMISNTLRDLGELQRVRNLVVHGTWIAAQPVSAK